jgi:hypothetical protein
VAENIATFLDAWKYQDQLDAWVPVHPAKIGAWALLVTMSFVLVASVKDRLGPGPADRTWPPSPARAAQAPARRRRRRLS